MVSNTAKIQMNVFLFCMFCLLMGFRVFDFNSELVYAFYINTFQFWFSEP